MFNKKDYRSYFQQLYQIEIAMKKECEQLLELAEDKRHQAIFRKIITDEIRHAKIVKEMRELI